MICAAAVVDCPPGPELFQRTDSPPTPEPTTAFPTCVHCWVGAAFHRMMPPKAFRPRLRAATVAAAEGKGPLVAAKYGITVEARAVAETFRGPSVAGTAIAVGVAPKVLESLIPVARTADAAAVPEIRTSRTSIIWVVAPP